MGMSSRAALVRSDNHHRNGSIIGVDSGIIAKLGFQAARPARFWHRRLASRPGGTVGRPVIKGIIGAWCLTREGNVALSSSIS